MNKKGKILSVAIFVVTAIFLVGFVAAGGHKDSCSDTDGGNVKTVFGTVTGWYGGVNYTNPDVCVDSGTITEYYCSGTSKVSSNQSCGTDTYVGNSFCTNNSVFRNYTDYFCSSGACSFITQPRLTQNCSGGTCSNGTCIFNNTCSDSDGGFNEVVFGTTSGVYHGVPYSNTDYCVNATILMESYCLGTNAIANAWNCTGNYTQCLSGQCV